VEVEVEGAGHPLNRVEEPHMQATPSAPAPTTYASNSLEASGQAQTCAQGAKQSLRHALSIGLHGKCSASYSAVALSTAVACALLLCLGNTTKHMQAGYTHDCTHVMQDSQGSYCTLGTGRLCCALKVPSSCTRGDSKVAQQH